MPRRKNHLGLLICSISFLFLFLVAPAINVNAADTITFEVGGYFNHESARSMLNMINEYRTSGNAWQLNENEQRENLGALPALRYDYDLERIAMQRAMELSVTMHADHSRPDGSECKTAYTEIVGYWGENAASGPITTQDAYTGWLEENMPYDWQGHRRNMLSPIFNSIGIAHFTRDGEDYWVQSFAYLNQPLQSYPESDGLHHSYIPVLTSNLISALVNLQDMDSKYLRTVLDNDVTPITITYGQSFDTDNLAEKMFDKTTIHQLTTGLLYSTLHYTKGDFVIADPSIATIENKEIVAKGVGQTSISVSSYLGGRISLPIIVKPVDISNCQITLANDTYDYTGSEIKPPVTVTYNQKTLTENVDYTVSYTDNIKPGFGKVTVTGIGIFTGSRRSIFVIDGNIDYYRNLTNDDSSDEPTQSGDSSSSLTDRSDSDELEYQGVVYRFEKNTATIARTTKKLKSYSGYNYIVRNGKVYYITKIAKGAFKNQKSLKTLDLSAMWNLKTIDKEAFSNTPKLKEIRINGNRLKTVATKAFNKTKKKAKVIVYSKNKKNYNKLVKKLKKSGLKKGNFVFGQIVD